MNILKKYNSFEELKTADTKSIDLTESFRRYNEFQNFLKEIISQKGKKKTPEQKNNLKK